MIPKPFVVRDRETEEEFVVVATGLDSAGIDYFLTVDAEGGMKWIDEARIHQQYVFTGFAPEDWKPAQPPPA